MRKLSTRNCFFEEPRQTRGSDVLIKEKKQTTPIGGLKTKIPLQAPIIETPRNKPNKKTTLKPHKQLKNGPKTKFKKTPQKTKQPRTTI